MKPLEGIRILDFTQFLSGPLCTMILADFGAEVIKIENPPAGDYSRYGNVVKNKSSSHYATRNRGKKSIVLNMKDERQKVMFLKLVETADAVVENFKPGTMEKFGITYEVLKKINPRIVYTSISGYGQDGPYARRAAFDATIQAEAGIMSITGEPGQKPLKCGAAIGDCAGGLFGCIGTLIGIMDAKKCGQGRRVDASMLDSLVFMQENLFSVYMDTGVIPTPTGNRYPEASPIGDFRCKDGEFIMLNLATDSQWEKLAIALGKKQWLSDPELKGMRTRADHYKKVEGLVGAAIAEYTRKEMEEILQKNGCAYGKINNYEQVVNHPQIIHRNLMVDAVYPDGTSFRVPGEPLHMSGVERVEAFPVVPLGYHTLEVLAEVEDDGRVREIMGPVLKASEEKTESLYREP